MKRSTVLRMLKSIKYKVTDFIDSFSIRVKLFSYAFLLIALMLLFAIFVFNQINNIRSRHIPARAAARDMEAALLTMRTHELHFINETDSLNAEFYLGNRSKSIDAWQENYRVFEENSTKLAEIFRNDPLSKELEAVQPLRIKYRDTFLALNGLYRERGFQSFGREGVLRQRASALQDSLASKGDLIVTFQKTQDAQNRFLLYREQSAAVDFRNNAAVLGSRLTSAQDKVLFNEYVRIFEDIVAIYQKIGLTATEGVRGELNRVVQEIMPHILTIETVVLSSTSGSITQIARYININTVLIASIAILLAFILTRLILNKITLLSEASQQIADGNLNYRLPVHTTDELGRLAASFNAMTEELQQGRKKLHERALALSQSVKRFELVARAVNEAVYEWDIKTGKLTWGNGIVSVFGYRPRHKTTTIDWWADNIHSEDADSINESLNNHFRRHAEGWKKEYRFKKASGEYVYCQDRGFIEYHNGQPVRMVGSLVDVSRQKALDRAKDEFISVASHQLRTPLGSIRWNLELLLENKRKLPKDCAMFAEDAYTSTLRMAGLVNDLLSVARIEQGRVQNIPEKTDLVEVIKAAIAEAQPLAKHRNIHINSSGLHNQQVLVTMDPKRFREVIQNLLSNGLKYTPPKGKVSVNIERRAKDFIISVSDNGIGIPLEDQSKMFGKFYRATNVTTTDTEGSGLGLFVVRSYVESWGGRVWFTSKVNEGTTFYVSIPHRPRIPK